MATTTMITGERSDEPVLYDARDLTTHAVILGGLLWMPWRDCEDGRTEPAWDSM